MTKEIVAMTKENATKSGYTEVGYYGKDYQLVSSEDSHFLAQFSKHQLIPCEAIETEDGIIMVRTCRRKMTGEEMAETLSDFVNSFSFDEKGFVKAILGKHRTLQQSIFRLFKNAMEGWAKFYDEGCYDDRNARTCELSKKMLTALNGEDYLPFI